MYAGLTLVTVIPLLSSRSLSLALTAFRPARLMILFIFFDRPPLRKSSSSTTISRISCRERRLRIRLTSLRV